MAMVVMIGMALVVMAVRRRPFPGSASLALPFPCPGEEIDEIPRLDHADPPAGGIGDKVFGPRFHIGPGIDEDVALAHAGDVPGGGVEAVRLDPRRQQQGRLDAVAADDPRPVMVGKEGGNDPQFCRLGGRRHLRQTPGRYSYPQQEGKLRECFHCLTSIVARPAPYPATAGQDGRAMVNGNLYY